jgi:hypothetical protein
MGQRIVVQQPIVEGGVAVFVTNRSLTGAGGITFESATDAEAGTGAAAKLAARLYAVDAGMRHVYVDMNHIVARRVVGWDDAHLAAVVRTVEELFVFYRVADAM